MVLKNYLGTPIFLVLIVLALLPFALGAALILSGNIYVPVWRWAGYEASWMLFGLVFVLAGAMQGSSPVAQLRTLHRRDIIAIAMVLFILAFSSFAFAPFQNWALYYGLSAPVALLVGLTSTQLVRNLGTQYALAVSLSLFVGILLHALTVYGFMVLEHGNSGLGWVQFAAPGFPNMRHYAFSAEVGIILGAGLFIYVDSRLAKIAILIGVAILWSLVFWTGARGAVLAIVFSFVLTMLIVPNHFRAFAKITLSSAAIGALMSLIYWLPDSRFGLFSSASRTINVQSADQLTSSRVKMWAEAIELIQNNPLFGYGPGQFAFLTKYESFKVNLHPHNALLEILLTVGVIGGGFLIYLLIKLWFKTAFTTREAPTPLTISIFWAVNTLIAHSMLAGSLFFIHSRLMLALLIGILAVGVSQSSRRKTGL